MNPVQPSEGSPQGQSPAEHPSSLPHEVQHPQGDIRGFPFERGSQYPSLGQALGGFEKTVQDYKKQLADRASLPESGEGITRPKRPVLYLVSVPGSGKSELRQTIIMPFAEKAAKEAGMEVGLFLWDKYEQDYLSSHPQIDPLQPSTVNDLYAIGEMMDQDIAARLKANPNLIPLIESPGGIESKLDFNKRWVARPYASTPEDLANPAGPFENLNLSVCAIGIVGGPHMVLWDAARDTMVRVGRESGLTALNELRQQVGLPMVKDEEYAHQIATAATSPTIDKIKALQMALGKALFIPT